MCVCLQQRWWCYMTIMELKRHSGKCNFQNRYRFPASTRLSFAGKSTWTVSWFQFYTLDFERRNSEDLPAHKRRRRKRRKPIESGLNLFSFDPLWSVFSRSLYGIFPTANWVVGVISWPSTQTFSAWIKTSLQHGDRIVFWHEMTNDICHIILQIY